MWRVFSQRWIYHGLIWLSFTGLLWVVISRSDWDLTGGKLMLGLLLSVVLPLMAVIYANFWAFDRWFTWPRPGRYLLALLLILGLGTALLTFTGSFFPPFETDASQGLINLISLLGLAMGLRYLKRGVVGQIQLQQLQKRNIEVELNALKAQINPHFLFNTLNNLYAINQVDPEKGSEMIMELAEVMRYHLRFSKMKRVSLADELQLIESYIELEKLRLTEHCELQVEFGPLEEDLSIAPLMFLPFVENAFKHGTQPSQPSFVYLKLWTEQQRVHLWLCNSLFPHKKTVKTHLGIANTRRRLELAYPQRHQLDIVQGEEKFEVTLVIEL